MGSSPSPASTPSAEFLAAFRRVAGPSGVLTFEQFMALALYDPVCGYYRQNRNRVGYGPGSDFYTATTSGPIFGELICAAVTTLLGGRNPHDYTFVEIGAEPAGGVLAGVAHPFGKARTVRIGENPELSGKCVVFSNELFDAQPFCRFVFRQGAWREIGVALADDTLSYRESAVTAPVELPTQPPEGYVIDAPLAAGVLARQLAAPGWTGLFVAFDYGKIWPELAANCPEGTARAYHQHKQSNDLLDRPGDQDLTCHICWDWLENALSQQGFAKPALESQEAFFVHHASAYIASVTSAEAARFSQKKLSLLQLLHPSHLGQKFQVLHAARGD